MLWFFQTLGLGLVGCYVLAIIIGVIPWWLLPKTINELMIGMWWMILIVLTVFTIGVLTRLLMGW